MRTDPDDRTARAIIRDEALALFAANGPHAVSVRGIAAAAQVSPALVLHHYGSKDGLCEAVDVHVLKTIAIMLEDLVQATALPVASQLDAMSHLPSDSPILRYLARMFIEGGESSRQLFHRVLDISQAALEDMVAAGTASPGADVRTRAAFLAVNDLAVLVFRELLTGWLGIDPVSETGLRRWSIEASSIYAGGLRAPVVAEHD